MVRFEDSTSAHNALRLETDVLDKIHHLLPGDISVVDLGIKSLLVPVREHTEQWDAAFTRGHALLTQRFSPDKCP